MQTCSGMSTARLLQRVPVADDVDERDQDVEAGAERGVIAAEALDDEGALLRHDDRRAGDDDDDQDGEYDDDDERARHGSLRVLRFPVGAPPPHSARTNSVRPSLPDDPAALAGVAAT